MTRENETEARTGKRRCLRRIAVSLLCALLVPVLALGAVWGVARTDWGLERLRAVIVSASSSPDGSGVEIGSLEGRFPSQLAVKDLKLRDAEGVWLEAASAEVTWSPLELFARRLDIQEIAADGLRLKRLPYGGEAESADTEPFSPPRLPVAVSLRNLDIRDLTLEPEALGLAARLAASGSLELGTGGIAEARLDFQRTDGVPGTLGGSFGYALDSGVLSVDVSAQEPAGGVIATLLALPGAPAVDLTLAGRGPLEGWQGHLQANAQDLARIEADIAIASTEPLAFSTQGKAEIAKIVPPDLAAFATPTIAFDVAGRLAETGEVLEIESASLESETVALGLEGRIDIEAANLEATAKLQLREASALKPFIAPAEVGALTIDFSADGPLQHPTVTMMAEAQSARLPDLTFSSLRLKGSVLSASPLDAKGAVLSIQAELTGEGARSTVPELGELLDPALSLSMAGTYALDTETLEIAKAKLVNGSLTLEGKGDYVVPQSQGNASITATERDLSRFSKLAGLELQGRMSANGDLSLGSDQSLRGPVTLRFDDAKSGVAELDLLLGGTLDLTGDLDVGPEGAVTVSGISAEGQGANLNGAVSLGPDLESLEAEFSANFPDLSLFQQTGLPLGGAASIEGTVSGPLTAFTAETMVSSRSLRYDGQDFENLALRVDARNLPDAPEGKVSIATGTMVGDIKGDANFRLPEFERLELTDLTVTRGQANRVAGGLTVPFDGRPLEGDLAVSSSDLGQWSSLAGVPLAGQASGNVALSADRQGRQSARLNLEGRSLEVDDALSAQDFSLKASVEDLFAMRRLQAEAALSGAQAQDLIFDRIDAKISGALDEISYTLQAKGSEPEPASLSSEGTLRLGERTEVVIAELQATLGEDEISLLSPARLTVEPERLRTNEVVLAVEDGRLTLKAEAAPVTVDLELAANNLPLSLTERFLPGLNLKGRLDGTASLSGPSAAPRGTLDAKVEGLEIDHGSEDAEVPPLTVTAKGRYGAEGLVLEGEVVGIGQKPASFSGSLPLNLVAYPPAAELSTTAPVKGRLVWDGKVEPLVALLASDVMRMEGAVEVDFALAGSLDRPRVSGKAVLTEGLYENFVTGTLLQPLEIALGAEDDRIVVERFAGRDPGGGRLSLSGYVSLADPSGLAMDLKATAEKSLVVKRDDVTAIMDADLALAGDLDKALLRGTIRSDRVEIGIVDSLPPSLTPLEVTTINAAGEEEVEETAAASAGPAFLHLDVKALFPARVFVRGRGLDSEWQGEFTLTGTAETPALQGALRPVRGGFTFAGRSFDLEREGAITFRASDDLDPELDIAAVYTGDDFTARVHFGGKASDPVIELTSVPEMPRDEIISQVLFGKDSTQLSAAEAFQVAEAAATLAGGGSGVLDIAREKLGVDVLTLAPGQEEGDLGAVKAGKYVSDDVFVGVEQGTTQESSKATMEVELSPSVTVESGVGANQETSVGVRWKWDY